MSPLMEEVDRLAALISYRVLDTEAEDEFDEYARLTAALCGTEIGAMTLIDGDRQWVKALHGELAREIPRDHGFCPKILHQAELVEVPDALLDPRFSSSPLVVGEPHIRFYAGVPLVTRSGAALGALCVIDSRPLKLSPGQRRLMAIAASHMSTQLELRRALLQLTDDRRIAADCRTDLAESNKQQQQMTAMLVHDFKSPLTTIDLSAEQLAGDRALTPDQREIAREIVDASKVLSLMVNDLLDVSSAENGALLLRRTPSLALGPIARDAIERSRSIANQRQQRVVLVAEGEPRVDGDPKILGRVINNLLDNAYKYAPANSEIRLELTRSSQHVLLRLIDAGSGVPAEQRTTIFQRYIKVGQTTNPRPSHGLGLAFCRIAVEAHGGTIEVEDSQNGCVFRVSLPAAG